MKLVKLHIIAWSVRKGFWSVDLQNERAETRLQCLASAMPKSVIPSAAKYGKGSKKKKRKDLAVLTKTPRLKTFFQQSF